MINLDYVHDIVAPTKCLAAQLTNLAPAMAIWHDGSPTEAGTPVTAATVAVAAGGNMTFTINGSGDTRIGTTGVITVTGLTAVDIYRAVNAVQGWNLILEGMRGANSVDNTLGELTAASCLERQVEPLIVTADLDVHGIVISNRSYATAGGTQSSKLAVIEDESGAINKLYYLHIVATDATAASGEITIWSIHGAESTGETLLGSYIPSASTTETILDFQQCPIVAKPNEHLLIQYVAGGAMTGLTELIVNGKSVIER